MEEIYLKRVLSVLIFVALLVLTIFIIKPIALSIISGLILAFIFVPVYERLNKIIKNKNISAGLIVFFLTVLIIVPLWFLTPMVLNQSIKIFISSQNIDYPKIIETIFPSVLGVEEFSREVGSILSSFTTKMTNSVMNSISALILNSPIILLQLLVVFFTFFFVMRDKERFVAYIKSLLPFSKEIETKFFKSSRDITMSVIYGQFIIGIIQGIIAGIGFFIFGVPNALFLTLIACIAGIFPIIGTTIIWIPVAIYLLVAGNGFDATGVLIFGTLSSTVDNFLRPLIVSKRTKLEPSVIIIGMIGGVFFFGILGLILGPLVLAYLLILLELYRKEADISPFLQNPESVR